MERELRIGQHLVFIDAERQERDALLICIHGNPRGALERNLTDDKGQYLRGPDGYVLTEEIEETAGKHWPCVNLVVVDKNEGAKDQYGRQTLKDGITSIVHWSDNSAHGFCWRFPDEEVEGRAARSIS